MKSIKRYLLILVLLLIAVVDVLVYWNVHQYYRAEKIEDNTKKIKILENAVDFFPSANLVYYERGRAYFNSGVEDISDVSCSRKYLEKSIDSFNQALKINPLHYYSHFYLAQSLLYMSNLFSQEVENAYEEYKKAAALAGENSQIIFDVAKVFFSRWSQLPDDDRAFTLEILKKLVRRISSERFQSLLYIWEMNAKDYKIIESILPEDPRLHRIYADFLGRKSLSLGERHKVLAEAEYLDFKKAKRQRDFGEKEFFQLRMKKAFQHFRSCLKILKEIKFYQSLTQQNRLDHSEFLSLKKSALLYSAKSLIAQNKSLLEVKDYLTEYLRLEDRVEKIHELEFYLQERGVLSENLEKGLDNLDSLPLHLLLYFKQNRFREIMAMGRTLERSFIVIPEDKREAYVHVLHLIGDSCHKLNYFYDADEFYQRALEIAPESLETLARIRQNYQKLGLEEETERVSEKIDEIISPSEISFENPSQEIRRRLTHNILLDGEVLELNLLFDYRGEGIAPLISVFFNGRVVWEDYLKENTIALKVASKIGKNSLMVIAVNRDLRLRGLERK